jgi:hypothetical protein
MFVGFEVLTVVVMKSTVFWDIKPCSPLKVNRLPPAFMLVSCSAYSLTLQMEICSSEISVDFQWATWCYVPEVSTLEVGVCETWLAEHISLEVTFLISYLQHDHTNFCTYSMTVVYLLHFWGFIIIRHWLYIWITVSSECYWNLFLNQNRHLRKLIECTGLFLP